MSTWSFTEYLNTAGYGLGAHSSWSQYTATVVAGDTVSVRTIYNGTDSTAVSINFVNSPNGSTTVNNPDPTTSSAAGLDRTWTSSGFSNSNHHTRWFFFKSGGDTSNQGQRSVRILTVPTSMGWSGVQANIEQASAGNAVLSIPSSFEPYIQGTASETGDGQLSTNGSKEERFHYRITSSSSSNTAVSAGFASSSGNVSGPSNGDTVTIAPSTSTPAGTYYIKLYHYDYTGSTGTSATLLDTASFTVSELVPLDTSITLGTDEFTLTETASSYSGHTMTGGGNNTLYYILNVSNFTNGSNIDALRQNGDSRYIARTFSQNATRTFETVQNAGTITNDLPSTGTFDTYYVYAANGLGQNSTKLTNTYTVGRVDTSISLTPSTTSLSATSTADVTVNVTGDTAGTQYRLYTNNIPRWVSTYNGGGSSAIDFTISYDEAADGSAGTGTTELPGLGQTFTYFSQARVNSQGGPFINTGDSFTITRAAAGTYSVSSPASVNEGQNLTYTVTTTNVVNNTTVGYTITGITSGDISSGSLTGNITINNNSGSTTIGLANDNLTDGNETAVLTLASTDSTGASTGSPSSSTTVVDTSNPGSGGSSGSGISGGSAGTYGLKINNSSGNVIIDDTSRIGNFLATATVTFASSSSSSETIFGADAQGNGGFDCTSKTVTGFIVQWTGTVYQGPTITRPSSGKGATISPNPNQSGSGTATVMLVRY